MKKLIVLLMLVCLFLFPGQNILGIETSTGQTLNNLIKDDVTSTSEDIVIEQDQLVSGNVTNVSGDITINGVVNGNVTTASGEIFIKGTAKVNGNISSATGDIHIQEPAIVQGNITTGTGDINKEPGAEVSGNITEGFKLSIFNDKNFQDNFNNHGFVTIHKPSPAETLLNSITTFLGMAAIVALLISLFPNHLEQMLSAFNLETGRVVLVGFLGWLLFPFVLLISILTIIGPLILGLVAALAMILGVALVAWIIGEKLQNRTKIITTDNKFLTTLLGLLILGLISLLPIAKVFVWAVCGVIGMGVILVTKFGTGRPWFPPKTVVVNPSVNPYPMDTDPVIDLSEGEKGGKEDGENKNL